MIPKTVLPLLAALAFVSAAALAGEPEPWSREAADARIQKHRTADVTLTVQDAAGKPMPGRKVTVSMARHKFLFGCNFFKLDPRVGSPEQKAYQDRYAALLNYATLPFYWGAFEPREGQTGTDRVRAMAEWCRLRGIITKGHPLIWHQIVPKWLAGRPLDEVERLQLGRIRREVTDFRGLIDRWDVINETVIMPDYKQEANAVTDLCKHLGRVELIKRAFAAAREANPKATLVLNDYETSDRAVDLARESLAAGVPVDVIGIQSHMHGGYWGTRKAWDVCERFAKLGKPLHFTELTLISGDMRKDIPWHGGRRTDWLTTPEGEERQAREGAEFYRLIFSHPATEAITWWDFSDWGAWMGAPSGLVRADMSPKPLYDALIEMIKKEWWTAPQELTTDAGGKVRFRGFLGLYGVSDGMASGSFTADTPGSSTAACMMVPGVP